MPKWKSFSQKLKERYQQENKSGVTKLYFFLRLLVILCLIRELLLGNYHNAFLCVLTLILFVLPFIASDKLNIKIPPLLEGIILIFIFSAEILGKIQNFYGIFPHWDTILHTLNGFLCAGIGFSLVYILNESEKVSLHLTPVFVALVSFCFSMTVGVLWEFFEYGADRLTKADMQKDTQVEWVSSVEFGGAKSNVPVIINNIDETIIYYNNGEQEVIEGGYLDLGGIDTMEDLIVNFIGATTFSVLGYFYMKNKNGYKILEGFIVRRKKIKKRNKTA